tara:strand:+ start:2171 stop:2398 length:228 start_codon:yes stop_codon:yes gene_type:complete
MTKNFNYFIEKISKTLEVNKKKVTLNLELGKIKNFDSLKVLEILALFENDFKKKINPSMINEKCKIKKLFDIYKK